MAWIPVPNSHDGDGYTTLVDRENGAAFLGAWLAILQVASKCDPRGTLLRDSRTFMREGAEGSTVPRKPHDAASISRMTRLPVEIIQQTLDVCVKECNWLQISGSQEAAEIPHPPAEIPHPSAKKGMEGNGRERTEGNGRAVPPELDIPACLNTPEFKTAWDAWQQHRREKRQPLTPTSRKAQLQKLEAMGLARAIDALQHSTANCYQGVFEPNTAKTHANSSRPTPSDTRNSFICGANDPTRPTTAEIIAMRKPAQEARLAAFRAEQEARYAQPEPAPTPPVDHMAEWEIAKANIARRVAAKEFETRADAPAVAVGG